MDNYTIALYIRLSIEDSKTDSMSIVNQRLALRKHAETITDANVEIIEFVDNGYSGTNFERPAIQELLELVKCNKINCIIVKDFSRFGRNSIETGYYIERVFPLFRTRFISINDHFDTINYQGDTGGMEIAFKYLINEYYSLDLSRKSKSAKYAKMRNGEYQAKLCCYGYYKGKSGRLEIDEEAASVVQMIFDLALENNSNANISRKLRERNIPTPGEYKKSKGIGNFDVSRSHNIWQPSTIQRILLDERYIGTYVMGKRAVIEVGGINSRQKDESEWIKIPNHHPPIISAETFERVQKLRRKITCEKRQTIEYLLKGKVICGCCEHTMSRLSRKIPRFACRHSTLDKNAPCHGLTIEEGELQNLLLDIILKQAEIILNIESCKSISELNLELGGKSVFERQIEECNNNKKQLYEAFLLKQIEITEYKSLKEQLDSRSANLKRLHMMATKKTTSLKSVNKNQARTVDIANEVKKEQTLTKELVDMLIKKVSIFPDGRIKIDWKMADFQHFHI